jgi:hypothetical protein
VIIRTSTTSKTIGVANGVVFTTPSVANGGWVQGMRIRVAVTASPATNWMEGIISAAVTATSVTIDVLRTGGSGTFAAWSLGIAAENATVLVANSTDTIALGAGAKTLNFPSAIIAIGWAVGTRLRFAVDANNYMDGNITAVSPTAVTINATVVVGSGSFSAWNITVAGERGATGAGTPGTNGTNGTNGASILSGAGVPSNALGNNGDTYLNTTNGDTYAKSAGTWTLNGNIKGVSGTNGTNGASILSGAGVPSNALGNNGDTYLNTTNGDTYAKSVGTWTLNGNIKGVSGTNGTNGANFLSGAGVPSNALGANGDSYLNTTNGDTYAKSAGTWTLNGNIKGTPGGAETVSPIAALPINWATGKIQRLAMSADLAPTPGQFQNPQSGFAHVIILTNASGGTRTFTLPIDNAHFTPATRGVTVADGKRRTLSAIYDGTSYHWAVGEELQNN